MRDRVYLFFIATYFAQGMVGIAYQPVSHLLKDTLGLTAAQSATFIAWMTLPLLAKPLLGVLTDAFPLANRRRAPYLLLASAATSAGWAALACTGNYSYWPVLTLLTIVNVGMAFSDVLCDGVMVELGKARAKTGPYQAAQLGTLYITLLATGVGGGWLAQHAPFRLVFGLTAVFPLFIFLSTFAVPEKPVENAAQGVRRLRRGMSSFLLNRSFWAAALVILLFNFTPFLGTAQFYYQEDALGFSRLFIGVLTSVGGIAGALGAAAFWWLCGRGLDTSRLIRWSVLAGGPLTLLYLCYRGTVSAVVLTAFFGLAGVVMRLSLMDLLAQACPKHGEATAFALFMSVFNLAAWASNTLGARVYDAGASRAHGTMAVLIILGAASTLACWPLLRFIPLTEPANREPRALYPAAPGSPCAPGTAGSGTVPAAQEPA
ncbi:MAG: MFS transporter [Elusimicrobiota bacterium]